MYDILPQRRGNKYLRDALADGGVVKVGGVAGVPLAEAVVEVELHKVAGDGGNEHVAELGADSVLELKHPVVPRPPLPGTEPSAAARQDLRHCLRHRRLLCHVQHPDPAASTRHRHGRRCDYGGLDGGYSFSRPVVESRDARGSSSRGGDAWWVRAGFLIFNVEAARE